MCARFGERAMEALVDGALLIIGLTVGAAAAWWLRGRELTAEREHAAAVTAAERQAFDERIERTLKGLAAEALDGSQKSFLQLAEQVFARHKEGADKTLEARQKEIAALLDPINKSLEEYK